MRFLRSNTAVIVTVGPFYDKTDGVTIETALTITNERITLTADTDAGSAPTNILDNVTGATAATANDLNYITGNDAGMMQLELAAADTNRVGRMFLSITDAANHVPVFHEFFVLPQAIYDWLTGVIVPLPANVTTWLGTAAATPTVAGVPEVDLTHVAGATTNVSTLATSVQTIVGVTAAVIADAVLDEDMTAHQTQGSLGQAIGDPVADTNTIYKAVVTDATGATVGVDVVAMKADTAAILVDTGTTLDAALAVVDANVDAILVDTAVIGAAGAGLTAVPWNASWDAEVQSEVDDALVVQRLDELLNADSDIDGLAPPTVGSVVHEMLSKTAGSFTFDQTTDSLEAIRDKETDIETDTAEIGAAGAGLTAINLPDQTMNITGDITGNLSGSVGSVTGAVGSVTGLTASNLDTTVSSRATPAQVNAEVVDALATDTYAEPAQGTPAATTTLAAKINFLFKAWRNRTTQTATQYSLYADDALTVDHKAAVSDDATTFDRGEIATGP